MPKSSGGKLSPEWPTETPAIPSGIPPDASYKCLRCGRPSADYICEKCALVESET